MLSTWKVEVKPLNYTRLIIFISSVLTYPDLVLIKKKGVKIFIAYALYNK